MNKVLYFLVLIGVAILIPVTSFSQYILNGSATKDSCNCYTLTQAVQNQSGSVWQGTKINLNDSFDFSFRVFLGCVGDGADGIVFILQPLNTSIGSIGQGLGFEGISPSIGISLDTYQNIGDPPYDNITIHANGVITHDKDLAGPTPTSASSNNIKDCSWHDFRVKWDPVTKTLSAFFDGVFRLSTQTDLIPAIFKNDPMVYWGFSGATGGHYNLQRFCTALSPNLNTGLINDAVCAGNPVNFKDSSISFTTIQNYYWDFGDGITSNAANPAHTYALPGIYHVKHSFKAADNCVSGSFTKTVMIGDRPNVSFQIFDTCATISPRLEIETSVKVGNISQWKWELDNMPFSNTEIPDLSKLSPGNHSLQLSTTSNIGCSSDTVTKKVNIKNLPTVTFSAIDGCVNSTILFTAQQTDNLTTISGWHWSFGDNLFSDQKNTRHIYTTSAIYPVQLSGISSEGCVGSFSKDILINAANAFAGNDTVVLPNTFFQLHGSGGSFYSWSPSTGLNNPNISDPVGNVTDNISYLLTVKTSEGCMDTSSVKVTVFKGSAIYVPTAFTPNSDGLNDFLKPYYIGIKSLSFFTIYNRWGQKVFSTNDLSKGWDGYFKGNQTNGESFVWTLKAIDVIGKIYNLKGTFVLLR